MVVVQPGPLVATHQPWSITHQLRAPLNNRPKPRFPWPTLPSYRAYSIPAAEEKEEEEEFRSLGEAGVNRVSVRKTSLVTPKGKHDYNIKTPN